MAQELPENAVCENDEYKNSELYKLFRPIFVSMKVVGLYFTREREINGRHRPEKSSISWRRKYTPSMIYSVIVLTGMIVNLVRMIGSIPKAPNKVTIVLFFAWKLLTIMNTLSCFIGCLQLHAIPEFFREWKRACPTMRAECMKKLKLLIIIITIFCWTLTFLNSAFGVYNIFYTTVFDHYMYPVKRYDNGVMFMKIFGTVLHFYYSAAWVFPVGLSYTVSHVLIEEFKNISRRIESSTDFKDRTLLRDLEVYRWRHTKFTAMVGHADDFLTYHLAASCSLNMVCTDIYILHANFSIVKRPKYRAPESIKLYPFEQL